MSQKPISPDRRQFLARSLMAGGALGLRTLLLGLPPSFLANRAMANTQGTYLMYLCSSAGEALNANCPGAYEQPAMHPSEFETPVSLQLGNYATKAAAPWANLNASLRSRMNFVFHDTLTNSHQENENVLRGQGAIRSESGNAQETLPSAIAQIMAPALGTINREPVVLSNVGSNVTFNSSPLPVVSPQSLKSLFTVPPSQAAANMLAFRNRAIDDLYSDLKTNGTPAQRRFLDEHAKSASQAKDLASELAGNLNGMGTNGYHDMMIAAVALFASGVSPVAVGKLNFGGDSHSYGAGQTPGMEVTYAKEAIAAIDFLWSRLNAFGMADKVTFCFQGGVFGRTVHFSDFSRNKWRGHSGANTVACLFGPNVRAGVTGGVLPGQFRNGPINSTDGTLNNPDIPTNETLASMAKTLVLACGGSVNQANDRITKGKVLQSVIG